MSKKDYKHLVLEYLKKNINKDVPRDELVDATGISKSRLSEILNSIKADGYTILTPPRSGLIRLIPTDKQVILPDIKDRDLRQWTILFLLSVFGPLTFRDIILKSLQMKDYGHFDLELLLKDKERKAYSDAQLIKALRKNSSTDTFEEEELRVAKDIISVTTLRKDLNALRQADLIRIREAKQVTYELTDKAPLIIPISEDSLYDFCQKYEDAASSMSELEPVKQAYSKIQNLICLDGSDYSQRKFGKINQISKNQIDSFNRFIAHPYKTNQLKITSELKNETTTCLYSVALLYYVVETGAFYALGRNQTEKSIHPIRIDYLKAIEDTSKKNTVFHHPDYYQIYNEMFAAGFDSKVSHVKVLIQDFSNVLSRFQNLHGVRKSSKLYYLDNPPEDCIYSYVYEDDIRGIYDFARFLRSFGSSVLALEPIELRDAMIYTYTHSRDAYMVLNNEQ